MRFLSSDEEKRLRTAMIDRESKIKFDRNNANDLIFCSLWTTIKSIGYMKKELRIYRTVTGKQIFTDWLESLRDLTGRAQITNRLNRACLGNFGDCEPVGDGVYELRVHYGPGYRIYFSEQEDTILLLLIGGSKRTQKKDIKKAKEFWKEFRERFYE